MTTKDDIDDLSDNELLARPGEAIPAGRLTAFFTRRAEVLRLHELDVMMLERSGMSARHFLTFADTDPRQRLLREEEERRRAWLAQLEMLEYQRRSDRLLAQIEEQERVVDKRRKEIEDNAIRLRDGRRVYVDGDRYRDEQGRVLEGGDFAEAQAQHHANPDASTWQDKQEIERRAEELRRLHEKVLHDRESGEGTPEEKRLRLSGYEHEFAEKVADRQQEMSAAATGVSAVPDYGSADYMAELGGDYKISTKPAFDAAAVLATDTTKPPTETETESATVESKRPSMPLGQSRPKLA